MIPLLLAVLVHGGYFCRYGGLIMSMQAISQKENGLMKEKGCVYFLLFNWGAARNGCTVSFDISADISTI
jgi:hypothetical protein